MNWCARFEPWQYRSEAQKLSMIKKVYNEFAKQCRRDRNIFSEQFPGLQDHYTKLVVVVRKAQLEHGETKTRQQKGRTQA
jgi:hypothetical protein